MALPGQAGDRVDVVVVRCESRADGPENDRGEACRPGRQLGAARARGCRSARRAREGEHGFRRCLSSNCCFM